MWGKPLGKVFPTPLSKLFMELFMEPGACGCALSGRLGVREILTNFALEIS